MAGRIFYVDEVSSGVHENHAGSKAREDVSAILHDMGFERIELRYDDSSRASEGVLASLRTHRACARDWHETLAKPDENDTAIIQFPLDHHSVFAQSPFKKAHKRGISIILFVHDLDFIRLGDDPALSSATKKRIQSEEVALLQLASAIVVHNERMKDVLASFCDIDPAKIISLQIFDYLIPTNLTPARHENLDAPIVIAGNLRKDKAGYIHSLPENIPFNLYGPNFDGAGSDSIHYQGQFAPEELPSRLEGSFGLVWDGESAGTCSGPYGDYLRVNNPHKASLYLASELPVIIWKEAALAPFVLEHGLGIAVSSLHELNTRLDSMDENDYMQISESVRHFAMKLRNGHFTREAVAKALAS